MKLKVSFDKNAIKEFLLEHVEKFAFAVIIMFFLALVAGAIWADRFERTADDLEQSAKRADDHINSIPPVADREAIPFAGMILDNRPPREDEYRHVVSWNPRLVNPMDLRDEPPVLLVRELRGSAGYGAFNMRVEREVVGGRRGAAREMSQGVRGQRWAVITGLVPVREQEQAFEEFFRERVKPHPEPDLPQYIYYRVERAEVDPYLSPSDPEQLKWTALNLRAALTKAGELWTGTAPEVVDEQFVHPRLVFPLGPKVVEEQARGYAYAGGEMDMPMGEGMFAGEEQRGPWGEEVAHPPQIPLKQRQLESEMDEQLRPDGTPPERRPDDPDFDMPMGGMPMAGMPMGAEEGMGLPSRRPGRGYPTQSRFMEGEGMRGPGAGMGMDEYAGEGMGMREQMPDHLLFRFFDYTVESGKSYRYRVRLMLANPNYGIDPKFLASPELAEKQWIEKDRWSEPTPVITVPRDTHVLTGGVHTQIRDTDEPSGTVAVVKWLEETGEEVHKDFRVTRGQLLDYPGTVIRERKQVRRDEMADEMQPGRKGLLGLAAAETEPEEPEKIDFITGMLVLDLLGGARLPGRDRSMTEPGRILAMDYDGTLRVLSEAQDKKEYERRTSEPETPETEMPDMMDQEMMMDDMMLLEGEGGGGPRKRPRRREQP
ncbi:MAG: hypothetical protein RBS80_15515 [Thermoguttaceae bacterium]|jgi:hypothetical protein|nr:hypothetical protein [Thermoguttaceae bacterium]